ncbi:unnamed protein product [Rhizoctonia solani]|uniref:Dihydroorotate dehydrogenase catalytic domain-containing protein n=2 Tax=Rhizoctonia solani TaxID=456999 RepID=A0A8H2ZZI2_9AGAM|nr:unnamed protein product [Rhizoctonia solani]
MRLGTATNLTRRTVDLLNGPSSDKQSSLFPKSHSAIMAVSIRGLRFSIPLLNSSCPWASSLRDLKELYASPFTGGVTTRTATLKGFADDPSIHQVAFSSTSTTSLNSYGYSPFPLSQYLEWVKELISGDPSSEKPIIISITFDPPGPNGNESEKSLDWLLQSIQVLRRELGDTRPDTNGVRIGVEINTSCPNIPDKPPPSYEPTTMRPLLVVITRHIADDPSLVVGLKLPPYVHSKQFTDIVDELAKHSPSEGPHPIAFLTCTNTLGSSILFQEQVLPSSFERPSENFDFAVPAIYGGLAGESIHPLSLGNVHQFSKLLRLHSDPKLQNIAIIGILIMGAAISQFTQVWSRLFGQEEMKLLILGLDNAGKTTMLYKITMGEAVDTAPTVGSNTEVFEYKNLKFVLWDIGGQTSLRQSWSQYFTAARAVILVIDSCDAGRLSLAKEELHKMCADESLKNALLLVFANKQDVRGCLTPARISEELKLTDLRDRQWHIMACSALTGQGLFEGLDWLASRLERR